MKKQDLWGRKTPGPYTKAANSFFDGVENGLAKAGNTTTSVLGAAGAGAAYAGNSALERGQDFNEWAQGLSDSGAGLYPYTRDGEVS